MAKLERAQLAFANDIRGGAEKSLGKVIARAFCNKEPLDLSSGDLPRALGDGRFRSIDVAMEKASKRSMAYDHPLYERAQQEIWEYITSMPFNEKERARAHAIPGISGFMSDAIKISAQALGYAREGWTQAHPLFIMTPPVHPHWIAVTEAIFGYSSIRTIKRTSDGLPDMDDTERVFRSIDRPFVVISTPDENPSGVCTPNSMLFNSEQTGLINRIRNNTKWGILLLDVIYMDVAWGENSGKRHEAIKAVHELGSRALVTHSLSKIFMKPGARIGGVAYVGALDEIGEELLARFKAVVDGNIKNGISAPTLSGLIEAYGGSEAIKAEIFENISQIRGRVEANEKIMNHGSISKAYPDSKIEAGFYGLHAISSDKKLPWRNPEYHQHLVDRIQKKLDFTDLDVRLAWREFRAVVGKKGMSASRAFAIECAMNGLMVLPHDPFWPMFSDNDLNVPFPDLIKDARGENAIIFRTILAYDPEITSRARDMITGVWEGGIRDYEKGVWRDKY